LAERKELLEEWKKMGECTSCIAALASQQEEDEQDSLNEQAAVGEVQKETATPVEENKKIEGLLEELFVLPLADVEEKSLVFKEVFQKDIIVLALLRHFG